MGTYSTSTSTDAAGAKITVTIENKDTGHSWFKFYLGNSNGGQISVVWTQNTSYTFSSLSYATQYTIAVRGSTEKEDETTANSSAYTYGSTTTTMRTVKTPANPSLPTYTVTIWRCYEDTPDESPSLYSTYNISVQTLTGVESGTVVTPASYANESGYGISFTYYEYSFASTGSMGGAAVSSVTITGNTTIYLHYTRKFFTLSFQANPSSSGGIHASATGSVKYGRSITATATPVRGQKFVRWDAWYTDSWQEENVSASEKLSVTMPGRDVTYIAVFADAQAYTLTLTADENTSINTVQAGGVSLLSAVYQNGSQKFTVYEGETVLLACASSPGSDFWGWCLKPDGSSVMCSEISYTFEMGTANMILYAVSRRQIKVSAAPYSGCDAMFDSLAPASGTVAYGTLVEWSAATKDDYVFVGWYTSANGTTAISNNAVYALTVTEDTTLYAKARSKRTYFSWAYDVAQSSYPADNPISQGALISTYLKATKWTLLQQNINLVEGLKGKAKTSFTPVIAGETELTADLYNQVLFAICNLNSNYSYNELKVTAKTSKVTAESFNVLQRAINSVSV